MKVIILLGQKADGTPSNLYTGLDGEALETAAEKAAASGGYTSILRVNNPTGTPYPTHSFKTVGTKPKFTRPKDAAKVKVSNTPHPFQKVEDEARKVRAARQIKAESLIKNNQLAHSKTPEGQFAALRDDGPTLEEFVGSGREAKDYPPNGYKPKDSAAYALYVESKKKEEKKNENQS